MAFHEEISEVKIDENESIKHMNRINGLLEKERIRLGKLKEEGVATNDVGEVRVSANANGEILSVHIAATLAVNDVERMILEATNAALLQARKASEKRFALIAQKIVDADPVNLLASEGQ